MTLTLANRYNLATIQPTITTELLEEYRQQLDTDSTATVKTYMNCLYKFVAWLQKREITQADYDTIVLYKKYLKEHEEQRDGQAVTIRLKAKTVNTYLAAIKDLYKFIERKGGINVASAVRREKTKANEMVRDCLTIDQVQKILNSIDTSTEQGARAYAMFKLMIQTGLRECEIARADISDIANIGNETVLYIQGKGETSKNEFVILYPSVLKALEDYHRIRQAKSSEPLFTGTSNHNNGGRMTTRSVQRVIKQLYTDNGIVSSNITTHSTRHTAITLAIINGASIQQAQAMARHKNINTTMMYFHKLDRLQDNAEGKLEQLLN